MRRSFAFGLVYLSLVPAAAQTPKDIAQQLWPAGAPITSNTAPRHPVFGNQFLPVDITERPALAGFFSSREQSAQVSNAFTGADLARLRGNDTPRLFDNFKRDFRIAEGHK